MVSRSGSMPMLQAMPMETRCDRMNALAKRSGKYANGNKVRMTVPLNDSLPGLASPFNLNRKPNGSKPSYMTNALDVPRSRSCSALVNQELDTSSRRKSTDNNAGWWGSKKAPRRNSVGAVGPRSPASSMWGEDVKEFRSMSNQSPPLAPDLTFNLQNMTRKFSKGQTLSPLASSRSHSTLSRQVTPQAVAPLSPMTLPKTTPKSKKPVSLAYLAHRWKIDLHTIKECSEVFTKVATLPGLRDDEDIHRDGMLNKEQMVKVACEICEVDSVSEMSQQAQEIMIMADSNGDGFVSFEEFATWYNNRLFVSFVSVDRKHIEVRELGLKLGLTAVEIEAYNELYSKFDSDGSGDIDLEEFSELLHKCMRVPAGQLLADSRVQKLWRECDIDGSGGIDLEEFVIFYKKHFDTAAEDAGTIDNYYSSIRRTSISIPMPGQ